MADSSFSKSPPSSTRLRTRVRADLNVVIAYADGRKVPARVIDVSLGGMHVRSERVPSYGEAVTVIVELLGTEGWHFLPARVRWFSGQGFGLGFERLDARQAKALERFVGHAA